jgi:hypothetical protein
LKGLEIGDGGNGGDKCHGLKGWEIKVSRMFEIKWERILGEYVDWILKVFSLLLKVQTQM